MKENESFLNFFFFNFVTALDLNKCLYQIKYLRYFTSAHLSGAFFRFYFVDFRVLLSHNISQLRYKIFALHWSVKFSRCFTKFFLGWIINNFCIRTSLQIRERGRERKTERETERETKIQRQRKRDPDYQIPYAWLMLVFSREERGGNISLCHKLLKCYPEYTYPDVYFL